MKHLVDFSLLYRNHNFCLLVIGQFVSFMGTMIVSIVLPYQIFTITQSTLMVGLLGLAQLVPLLFTALIGGVFADRYHRRMLLLFSESFLAIGSLLLASNAHQATPGIAPIFIIATLMAAVNGLHRPALDSMVQQIVNKEDYSTVASLATIKASVCMIGGPPIGSFLIVYFGVKVTFLVDFASYLISLLAILMMTHIPKPVGSKDVSTFSSIKEGFQYAGSRQELVGSYLVDFVAMIFGMPNALFPALAQSFGGAKTLGILYAAPAVGALIVSFFKGWVVGVKRHGRAIALAAIGWGVAIIFFGLSTNFFVAIFFLAIAGAFDGVSAIFRSIMWNETIPQALRGRLAGIEMISYLSGPRLGDAESGLVAAVFGITASIVSGGVMCVLGVVGCCYFLPKFWNYQTENVKHE